MYALTPLNLVAVVLLSWSAGALAGATLFYAIGRSHGIQAMAAQWRKANDDDAIATIAAKAGAAVRGRTSTKA